MAYFDDVSINEADYSIIITPNPVLEGMVNISVSTPYSEKIRIALLDFNGIELLSVYDGIVDSTGLQKDVSMHHLAKGIYYFSIASNNARIIRKIILN
jgi:hypothetical protein